ncbi:MAG TPA: PAS domain S-box protein, partial [Blastocatellia bacterium]|nr:PAS domain S-box protein [Blastocatellia bacterium]
MTKTSQWLKLPASIAADIEAINNLHTVPTILNAVAEATGLRYVVIARVTPQVWTACAVLDRMGFGLGVGDSLEATTTLCYEILGHGQPIVVEDARHDQQYAAHPTPKQQGFESYIAVPIYRQDGVLFGTLCALDSRPARLDQKQLLTQMNLFAELISAQLEAAQREAVVRQNEQWLRQALAGARAGAWVWEPERERAYWSPEMYELFGLDPTREAPDFEEFTQLIHPSDRVATRAEMLMAAERGGSFSLQFRVLRTDGTTLWINSVGRVEHNADGRVQRLVGVNYDITSSKEAELEKQKFVALIENSSEFIATCDLNFKLTYANDAAYSMLGLEQRETAQEIPFQDFFFPEDWDFVRQELLPKVLKEGRAETEIRLRNYSTGEAVWMLYNLFKMRDEQGRAFGLASVSKNITERKRAEIARAQLSAIVEASADAIYVYDFNGNVLSWNKGAETLYGYAMEEIIGHSIAVIFPSERQTEVQHIIATIKDGESIRLETVRLRRDGSRFDALLTASPIRSGTGTPIAVSVIVRDISERKRAEESLRTSQARLALAMDTANIYAWEIDLTSGRMTWSENTNRVLGFQRETTPATTAEAAAFSHPDDIATVRRAMQKVITGEQRQCSFEQRLINPADGSIVWLQVQGIAETLVDGKPTRIVGLSQNITARKQAEEALRTSEARYRASFHIANVGKMEVDAATGRFLLVNDAFCRIVGWSREELLQMTPADLIHPDDRAWDNPLVAAFFRGETDEYSAEKRFGRKDGQTVWVRVNCSLVRNANGKPLHSVGVLEDITERKETEEALRESEERLRLAAEAAEFGIYERSFEPDHLEWSPILKRIFGLSVEAPVSPGEPLQHVHPDDYERVAALIKGSFDPSGTGDFEDEHRIIRADGAVRWIRVKGRTEFHNGKPRRAYGSLFDITERKRNEQNLAFLADLQQEFSQLLTVPEITETASRRIAEYFQLTHCLFVEIDEAAAKATVFHDCHTEDVGSLAGTYRIGDFHTEAERSELALGRPIVINNVREHKRSPEAAEAFVALGIGALLNAPYLSQGRWRFVLSATHNAPHQWRADECELLQELAARVYLRLERARAEAALRKSEAEFRTISNAAPALVWVCAANGNLAFLNDRWFDYTGQTMDQAQGFGWTAALHPDDAARILPYWEHCRATGETYEGECRYRSKEGEYRWHIFRALPQRGANGEIENWFGCSVDVHDTKLAQGSLRESEERFRSLFESIDEGFVIVEMMFDDADKPIDYRFVQANPAFTELTGLPADALGRTARELVPELEEFWFETYGRVARTGEAVRFENVSVPLNRWFEVYASRVGGAESRRVAIVFNNITARKIEELNQQLLLRVGELIRATSDVDTLFNGVAHLLGERLVAAHCHFNEINPDEQISTVRNEYRQAGTISLVGTVSLADYSQITRQEIEQGQTIVVHNTQTDERTAAWYAQSYQREGIGAYIACPLMREGQWMATLWVGASEPRDWQDGEVALVRLIGERVWLAAEKLRSENQVRESEERLRMATDAASMFSWEVDFQTQKMKWSDNTAKVMGCAPEELTDNIEQATFFVAPEERERLSQMHRFVLQEGQDHFSAEFHGTRNRFWQAHCLVVRDRAGHPTKLIGVTQDITERKRFEEQLQMANYRFRVAEEAVKGFNYEWDLKTGNVTWSAAFANVMGYNHEELGQTWHAWANLMHPDDRIVNTEADALAFINNLTEDTFGNEYRVRHKDGHYIWVLERSIAIRDERGVIQRLIGQTVDITERKQIEAERERLLAEEQRLRQQAEEAARAKDDWLAMVTHELRSPLNAILGHARLLKMRRNSLSPELAEFAELVRRNGERQNELINDLLDTARIMTGKLCLELGPVDLVALMDEALDAIRPSVQAKDLQLSQDIAADVGVFTGDAARLQQVIWNLLTNAVKFTPSGGSLDIRLHHSAQQVVLTVRDSGQGITPEFLPLIFERFSQADNTRSRRHGGLGLGLALVRQIVELHGGTITAESAGYNQGATFTVTLPRRRDIAQPVSAYESAIHDTLSPPMLTLPTSLLADVKLLVVEDEEDARDMLLKMLSDQGAHVQVVSNAQDAWPLLTTPTRPQVVICDIGLPGEDGYSLLRRVRQWEQKNNWEPLPA